MKEDQDGVTHKHKQNLPAERHSHHPLQSKDKTYFGKISQAYHTSRSHINQATQQRSVSRTSSVNNDEKRFVFQNTSRSRSALGRQNNRDCSQNSKCCTIKTLKQTLVVSDPEEIS